MAFDPRSNNTDALTYLTSLISGTNIRMAIMVIQGLRTRLKAAEDAVDPAETQALRALVKTLKREKTALELASLGLEEEVEALTAKLQDTAPKAPVRKTRTSRRKKKEPAATE